VVLSEGTYANQSGTVIRIEDRVASVMLTNQNKEVKCLANSLKLSLEAK